MKKLEFNSIKKMVEQKRINQIKTIGTYIKRSYKKFGQHIYIINAYQKDNLYTFGNIIY